jgi:hypothetical protein
MSIFGETPKQEIYENVDFVREQNNLSNQQFAMLLIQLALWYLENAQD